MPSCNCKAGADRTSGTHPLQDSLCLWVCHHQAVARVTEALQAEALLLQSPQTCKNNWQRSALGLLVNGTIESKAAVTPWPAVVCTGPKPWH